MPANDTTILIVDDTKFSSAVVEKAIKAGGYQHVRSVSNAADALKLLEKEPVTVLIADWLMPEMDGLELVKKVRELDKEQNHATYCLLLTAKEGDDALKEAFDEGVDDFVNKSVMNEQLLPRIFAAERISVHHNALLHENHALKDQVRKLKNVSTIDPLTGLGNRQHAVRSLEDHILHTESREGTTCYLLFEVTNLEELMKQYPKRITDELLIGIGKRLKQLVRPLDGVARVEDNQFALITLQPDLERCNAGNFRRLHDGISLNAYKTAAGYVNITTSFSLAAADTTTGLPSYAQELMDLAASGMPEAKNSGVMAVKYYEKKEATGS